MRAGQASAQSGVTVKALRYYEGIGLIEPARLANGYRDYSAQDVRLVAEIRALIALGMSPKETRPFLDCLLHDHDDADDCPESLAAYQDKIDRLGPVIARLTQSRDELTRQMHAASQRGFPTQVGSANEARPNRTPNVETTTYNERTLTMLPQPDPLPDDLPVPEDDGAAGHLPGQTLPPLEFTTSDGERVRLDTLDSGRWVLYLYPLTGEPGVDMPRGWSQIPGARGCTAEACGFRDNLTELREAGARRVLALSSDDADYQQALVSRMHLPYPMLSDPQLNLAAALGLPTFEVEGMTLYKRLTMVVDGDRISHVFYPIFPPGSHAAEVLDWLRANPVR